MKRIRAVVYRSYEIELEFNEDEMMDVDDPDQKAEFLSRTKDISEWTLVDVASDVITVTEV
jgi:hypothetical protein